MTFCELLEEISMAEENEGVVGFENC